MKLLLAVTMTMLFAGSAFGACSKDSTKDCTESECKNMNYTWTKGAPVQCMSPDGPVATNCPESADGSRAYKALDSKEKVMQSVQGTGK